MSDVINVSPLGTGVATWLGTPSSANLAAAVTDETGSGALVFGTSPALSSPTLTGTPSASGATSFIIPIAAGAAPTANGDIRFDSTQGVTMAGGAGAVSGGFPRVLYVTNSTTDTLTAATINTTETQFASTWQIPANYLTANKTLRVTYITSRLATATVPTSLFKIRLGAVGIGGTTVYSQTATAASAGTRAGLVQYLIQGTAAAGASVNVNTAGMTTEFAGVNGLNTTAQPVAIATNAAQNINLTMTFSSNSANNTWTILGMVVEELW